MAQPTRVEYVVPATNFASTADPKTTPAFSVAVGDVLVVSGASQNTATTLTTPTTSGGNFTWVLQRSFSQSTYCNLYLWTGTCTTAGTGITLTETKGAGTVRYGIQVVHYTGVSAIGASFVTSAATGVPSGTFTTTGANSTVEFIAADSVPVDGSTRAYLTVNGSVMTEQAYFFGATQYTVYSGYRADAGAAGSKTVGLSAPTGQKWSIVGIEMIGYPNAAAPLTGTGALSASTLTNLPYDGPLTGTGDLTVTAVKSATKTATRTSSGTLTATATASPTLPPNSVIWGMDTISDSAPAGSLDGPRWTPGLASVGSAYVHATRVYGNVTSTGTNAESLANKQSLIVTRWNQGVIAVVSLKVTNSDFVKANLIADCQALAAAGVDKFFLVLDHEPLNNAPGNATNYSFTPAEWEANQLWLVNTVAPACPQMIPTVIMNGFTFYNDKAFNTHTPYRYLTPALMTAYSAHAAAHGEFGAVVAIDAYTADGFGGVSPTANGPKDSLPYFANWCRSTYGMYRHGVGEMGAALLAQMQAGLAAARDLNYVFVCWWNHRGSSNELIDTAGDEKLTAFRAIQSTGSTAAALAGSGVLSADGIPSGGADPNSILTVSLVTNVALTATPTVTLPTIPVGFNGRALIGVYTNNGTNPMVSAPSGWGLSDGPVIDGNGQTGWLYTKTITSADSGTTLTWTLTAAARPTIGGILVPDYTAVSAVADYIQATQDTVISTVAITPAVDNGLDVILNAPKFFTTIGGSMIPPAGWTEQVDVVTNQAGGPWWGAYVATRVMTGQNGVSQAAPTFTSSGSNMVRTVGFRVVLMPATVSLTAAAPLSGSGTLSATATKSGQEIIPFSTVNGTGSATTIVGTLPTIPNPGYAVVAIYALLGSTGTIAPPAGWTPLTGQQADGSGEQAWIYGRKVTAADSGIAHTWTFGSTPRAVLVGSVADGYGGVDDSIGVWVEPVQDLDVLTADLTPITPSGLDVITFGPRYFTAPGVITPPAGWTQRVAVTTSQATGPWIGGGVATRQFVNQSGVLQPAPAFAVNGNNRNVGWRLSLVLIGSPLTGNAPLVSYGILYAEGSMLAQGPLTGSGDLTATVVKLTTRTAALTGTGTLTAAPVMAVPASAPLTGSGSLSSTGFAPVAGPLSGSGTLSATAAKLTAQTAALTGSGTLSAVTAPYREVAGPLTGSGALAATGIGLGAAQAAASFTGIGTLAVTTKQTYAAAAPLSSTGTLSVTTLATASASAPLTGVGTLTTTAVKTTTSSAALTGSGTLSGTTVGALTSPAPLGGFGNLFATAVPSYIRSGPFTGAGTLVGIGGAIFAITLTKTGSGALSATATASLSTPFAAPLSGVGTLVVGIDLIIRAIDAPLAGVGTLSASGRNPGAGVTRPGGRLILD